MVYPEILKQAQLFVLAIPLGAALLFVYDLLRVVRRVVRHGTAGIAVEDMLFWIVSALLLFGFMYRQNEGVMRGFIILGAFFGMVFYRIFFSRRVVKGGTAVLSCIVRAFGRFFRAFCAPFRFFGSVFCSRFRKVFPIRKKSARSAKKQLKKIGKAVRIGFSKL
ncbi:MAG: spore cortex biosynthesis protein YabQ [Clostridiales bacterium]|nr:spore cortex biosynthesis protein YabQ [Clostridiales bacterium]